MTAFSFVLLLLSISMNYSLSSSNFNRFPKLIDENDQFAWKVREAVKVVETILDNTRNPSLASPNQEHSYNDKYTFSEFLTNTAVTASLNVLEKLGLGCHSDKKTGSKGDVSKTLSKLTKLVQDEKKSYTMRFFSKEKCTFDSEKEIEIESPREVLENHETSSSGNIISKVYSRVVKTKVKEYHWKIEIDHGIYFYAGSDAGINDDNSVPIVTNTISSTIVTRTSTQPFAPIVESNPIDVSLTWLLKTLNKETLESEFKIEREKPTCRTPRNNDEIQEAWKFFTNFGQWFTRVYQYFNIKDRQIYENHNHDKAHLQSITGDGIFVPVLPLFETLKDKNDDQSPILSNEDVNLFLNKQYHTMTENIEMLHKNFSGQIMSSVEAVIFLLAKHSTSLVQNYFSGINHIEDMLCTQLYNAIGKHVSNDDLDEFVRSYNQKLFADSFTPESFCYAVRRPDHYPDGLISIEERKTNGEDKGAERNAMTFTRKLDTDNDANTMHIPINSATSVNLTGDLFLHAWMMQRFQQSRPSFQLASRARQFSSFLLLVGKLSGPNTFQPEHGIILQNQDEVLIPLLLEEMPSAKEFKDAIESLSTEQQEFAKAFRNMKLSSSVFGVCVVQLKPQLETLLGLPERSLTKEIRLTQSLLSLFIDYQIPSDLLSFDGDDSLGAAAKVEIVKGHVKNVEDMIDDLKKRDMKQARMEANMAYEQHSKKRYAYEDELIDDLDYDEEHDDPMMVMTSTGPSLQPSCVPSTVPSSEPSGIHHSRPKHMMRNIRPMSASMHDERFTKESASFVAQNVQATPLQNTGNANTETATSSDDHSSTNDQTSNTLHINQDHTDLTMIPKVLDSKFELFGDDEKYGGTLRSTTIKTAERWTKNRKQNILSKLETITLSSDDQKVERQKAFDLLDALSRSGVLPLSHAELHVVIASTHCFDKSVVNTVIQDNVNPIEKIERSYLLVASIIHNVNMKDLLSNVKELDRISNHSPMLMDG